MPELIFFAVIVYGLGWIGSALIFKSVDYRRDRVILASTLWPFTIAFIGLMMLPDLIDGDVKLL